MLRPRHRKHANTFLWLSVFLIVLGTGIVWKMQSNAPVVSNTANMNSTAVDAESGNGNFAFQPEVGVPTTTPSPAPKTTADVPQDETACQSAEGEWLWSDGRCRPADRATCVNNDGLWGPSGNTIPDGCSLWAEDGGKSCSDSAECIGRCIIREGDIPQDERTDDELSNITGHCSERARIAGCYSEAQNGVPVVLCE